MLQGVALNDGLYIVARIKIELEDTDGGGMIFKIDADGLATMKTVKTNTCVQNSAILLIEVLKECGIDKGKLPNLTNKRLKNIDV